MHRTAQEVIREIRDAFQAVSLGDGVGLFEGRALDDYADEATRRDCRSRDERSHWDNIPRERLEAYNDALSFLDAEGMRFHLPAFLILELEGPSVSSIFHLTELDDWKKSKLALLSKAQSKAIREFLLFVVDEPDYEFWHQEIRRALGEYWRDDES